MTRLVAVFIRRPVFSWVLVLAVVVTGLASLRGLPLERYPNVDIPAVTVTTLAPGMSATQIESEVTSRIESALGTVAGLERVDSVSQEGMSSVVAQFVLSKHGPTAAQDVREKVARVATELPSVTRQPQVELFNANSAPVLIVALTTDRERSPAELTELGDGILRREISKVKGVGDVRLFGSRKRSFRVELDTARLATLDVTPSEVQASLAREELDAPGGEVIRGGQSLAVRIFARARTPEELSDVVLTRRGGVALRVRDVGRVVDSVEAPTSLAVVDGRDSVLLAVLKQPGENTLSVLDEVHERLAEINAQRLPAGVHASVVRDEGVFVKASLDAVKEHLLLGSVFAALTVLVFLRNGRATVISALAIPASIIGAFGAVKALGLSLNMLSLLGLTLAVGIVIDDAVVVLENVVRVIETRKLPPLRAAAVATSEIALAVLATTLSLVAVFLPIGFMGGIVGRFLSSFGLTMAASILLSMGIAFTLTPMLCGRWLKGPPERSYDKAEERAPRPAADHGGHDGPLERWYGRLVASCLKRRWGVGLLIVATVGATVPLGLAVPQTFLPAEDEGRFEIWAKLPEGALVEQTTLTLEDLAQSLRGVPHVAGTVVMTGAPRGDASGRGPNEGTIYVRLDGYGFQTETMAAARRLLSSKLPPRAQGMVNVVSDFAAAGPDGASVQYVLRGPDVAVLRDRAAQLLAAAKTIAGTSDHGITLDSGAIELLVSIDRARASELGVTQADVADALRLVGRQGVPLGSMRDRLDAFDTTYPVSLGLRDDGRDGRERLREITVRGQGGRAVTLAELGELKEAPGPSQIRRSNRERQVTLFMTTAPGVSEASVVQALEKSAQAISLPPGYAAETLGNAKELDKATAAFATAIVLSFVFMYLTLAAQFESWIHPVTILVSLPLTVPFALLSLLVTGQTLNVFSALGLLVLFGIVKKNAILQLDHTLALRRSGLSRIDAVVRANQDRLRPILMTTVAFVAGLVPLVTGHGPGAGTNTTIGVCVMGGQVLALALTLVATPVVYTWFDDVEGWFARRRLRDTKAC